MITDRHRKTGSYFILKKYFFKFGEVMSWCVKYLTATVRCVTCPTRSALCTVCYTHTHTHTCRQSLTPPLSHKHNYSTADDTESVSLPKHTHLYVCKRVYSKICKKEEEDMLCVCVCVCACVRACVCVFLISCF